MKKILFAFFFLFILIFGISEINAEKKDCVYYSFENKVKKTFPKNDECPIVVNGYGSKIDLSKTKLKNSDTYYLLDGYSLKSGISKQKYDSNFYVAQINYKVETKSQDIQLTYLYNQNSLTLSNDSNIRTFNNVVWENFLTSDKQIYYPLKGLQVGVNYDTLTSKIGYLDVNLKGQSSTTNVGVSDKYEAKIESSFVIYDESGTATSSKILKNENYCGVYNFSVKLYDNDTVEFYKQNYPTIKLNKNFLPDFVYVRYSSDERKYSVSYDQKLEDGWFKLEKCKVQDAEETNKEYDIVDGTKYTELLGQLKIPLYNLNSLAINIKLTINNNENATLNDVTESYELCSDDHSMCEKNANYLTEKGIKNVRSYCNEVYSLYPTNKNVEGMKERMAECTSFNNFYKELVDQGIINNLEDGCGIITDELKEKLDLVLDIIKIAGPLLALGLGTIDFVKVIVNGDADKEMKTAFKRFLTRLIAAALLFIIPIIIAFLLDIFMKPDSGYESDNPFCSVIDWDE